MNQERFDELAKGLAINRLSRGQVLKGLAASLLMAGPLGTFLKKPAFAQSSNCVSVSCTDSAQQAYNSCAARCKKKRGKKRKQCLKSCGNTYAGQQMGCGCVTVDLSSTTPKYTPCEDPCTPQTLYEQASQDVNYSMLEDYLTNDGFAADRSPTASVYKKDGTLERSLLTSTYSNPTRTNEVAALYYDGEATGDPLAFAIVWDKQQAALLYLLFVLDDNGPVEKVHPSAAPQRTSKPSTVSSAATGKSCNSAELWKCRQDAASEKALEMAVACGPVCFAPPPVDVACPFCVAGVAALYADKLRKCSEDFGCGAYNFSFCKDNACCSVTEPGCNGTCCSSGQICCEKRCISEEDPCCPEGQIPCVIANGGYSCITPGSPCGGSV